MLSLFRWRGVSGTVILVEKPYYVKAGSNSFFKLIIFILLLPVIIAVVIASIFMFLVFSISGLGGNGGRGSLCHVGSHTLSFFLTGVLFGPKDQIAVRDIRLRDASGAEHMVRLRGELTGGNVVPGDDVEVWGFDRQGTLQVHRGNNLRTGAAIRVK